MVIGLVLWLGVLGDAGAALAVASGLPVGCALYMGVLVVWQPELLRTALQSLRGGARLGTEGSR